jgi:hypothetical protein
MASGHVNRTNRPNTWLHRPTCKREALPTRSRPHMAHRDVSLRFQCLAALRGEADIPRTSRANRSVENDSGADLGFAGHQLAGCKILGIRA